MVIKNMVKSNIKVPPLFNKTSLGHGMHFVISTHTGFC
ncbi:choline/carnitine O-acyltransferase [Escherichia coli]|nr:choline/carnitine O-acyltransferase [Escherichia coli]EFB2433665.1 choline/carnitine O-acyltransferase [Escherichia coli]EFC4221012.1 choline/carnitine O-acyltransferase [Escherichia coli]EFI5478189.1 choline/carnitine O-acyltransferase [Escherichia coli]EFN5706870.1 choline/carnitine O-acyltransferase [Escherichia coli]